MAKRTKKTRKSAGKIKGFLLGSALAISMKAQSPAFQDPKKLPTPARKEVRGRQLQQGTSFDAIELNTIEDMYELFDMSLNIIFAELVLEEVPMTNAYDDHGKYKGRKNTIGTGSTYCPLDVKDWDNPDANWYHLYTNPKTFENRTVTYQEMLQLVVGWAKYRTKTQNPNSGKFVTHKTILERMFDELQGAALRPNEFAALFCAVYNNENNISKLCPYIKDHYDDPIACANKIMMWSKTGAANGGTCDRCEFEALVYLNANNFCDHIMELYTKPLKTTGYSCVNVKGVAQQTLTRTNYTTYSNNALSKYRGVVYSGGVCTRDVCTRTGWLFANPLPIDTTQENELQKSYDDAIKVYKQKNYEKALELFLELESQGASGADLWNNIAITYYNLKQYDNCITYCKKVLETTEYGEYAKACYNAGLAYEALKNYDRAILNYEKALTYYQEYGVSAPDPKVDYEQIYQKAKERVEAAKTADPNASRTKASRIKEGRKQAIKNFVARIKKRISSNQKENSH